MYERVERKAKSANLELRPYTPIQGIRDIFLLVPESFADLLLKEYALESNIFSI